MRPRAAWLTAWAEQRLTPTSTQSLCWAQPRSRPSIRAAATPAQWGVPSQPPQGTLWQLALGTSLREPHAAGADSSASMASAAKIR